MINAKLIINGREETSERAIEVVSPADTRVVLGAVPDATSAQVDEAARRRLPRLSRSGRHVRWKNGRGRFSRQPE